MPSGMIVQTRPTVGRSMETLTVTNAVQVLTPALYSASTMSGGAQEAFLTNYGAAIRYSYCSGVTPSATNGHVLPDGGTLVIKGQQQMKDFKCFRVATDSEITVTYEFE